MTLVEFMAKGDDLLAEFNYSLKKSQDRGEFFRAFFEELLPEVEGLEPEEDEDSEESVEGSFDEEDDI